MIIHEGLTEKIVCLALLELLYSKDFILVCKLIFKFTQ